MGNQSKKKHCCSHENCGARFDRPFKLAQHMLIHNNIKSYFCTEDSCSKSYISKSHLDRHINSVHKNIDNHVLYSCPKCLKKFANRQNVKRHIRITHAEKISFLCDICNMTFRKKNLLSAHMYQHTGIKSFSCEMCSEDFISLYEKKRHLRFHKIHKCNECEMTFNHWSKYQKHRKMHNAEKVYICNDCNRHFNQRAHLVRHIKIHLKNVQKRFPCSYPSCDRVYSRRANLKQHIMVKHEKLRHECKICGAQLSAKATLNHHIELHKNPREFKPKTLSMGRKERKDKGSYKTSTALQLAGILERSSDISETFETLEIVVTFPPDAEIKKKWISRTMRGEDWFPTSNTLQTFYTRLLFANELSEKTNFL